MPRQSLCQMPNQTDFLCCRAARPEQHGACIALESWSLMHSTRIYPPKAKSPQADSDQDGFIRGGLVCRRASRRVGYGGNNPGGHIAISAVVIRLADTLEQAHFGYDEESFRTDWQQVIEVIEQEESANAQPGDSSAVKEKSKFKIQPPSWFKRVNSPQKQEKNAEPSAMDELRKAKQLLDDGALTSEEFAQAKARILEAMGTK